MKKKLSAIIIVVLFLSSCTTLPDRKWSATDKVLAGISVLAAAADTYTTMEMLDNGHRELNPLMGGAPFGWPGDRNHGRHGGFNPAFRSFCTESEKAIISHYDGFEYRVCGE